jgi:hypothetical protein
VSWLWSQLGYFQTVPTLIHLKGVQIELLNALLGEGSFQNSGWCYHKSTNGETWMVNEVELSFDFKSGTLRVKFHCDACNANNESFKVK